MWPETTETAPNSPIARALQSSTPAISAQRMLGRVTVRKAFQPVAPSVNAASSSAFPSCCMTGMSSRATNGQVTNIVASAMPGTAKMIWMWCAATHGPSNPCAPNTSTKTRPLTTGDTEKGMSISVTSALLPGNWNLAIAQAAHTPNTMLIGTAIAAIVSVSRIAERASGSASAIDIGAEALAERFGRDDRERRDEKETQEGERQRDQPQAQSDGIARGEDAAFVEPGVRHDRFSRGRKSGGG